MSRIHISQFIFEGRQSCFVYDVQKECLVTDVSDYILIMSEVWSSLTLTQECRSLVQFWEYLCKSGVSVHAIDDSVIRNFRDEQFKSTISNRNSRGKRELAESTVNSKLRRVYHWLHWMQSVGRQPTGFIGAQGQISSALDVSATKRRTKGAQWRTSAKFVCPLLFKVKGGRSKHQISKHVPSESTVDDLHAFFFSTADNDFIARRNCLFVDIVNRVGLRRGAANSLLVSDFSEERILAATEELWVIPERQKFDYSFSFPIPIDLAWEIHHFIDSVLAPFLDERRFTPDVHLKRIFVSATTGAPMTDRAMTQIVSKAMRGLGFPKGVGPHSFRWKFTGEALDRSLERRRELGLDTTARSIAAETSLLLGHANPDSIFPYAVASLSKATRSTKTKEDAAMSRLRADNLRLRSELSNKTKSERS